MSEDFCDFIRQSLSQQLSIDSIEIIDESHRHRNHAGAKEGGGHYIIRVVSNAFEGLTRVQRHQKVHEIFSRELAEKKIHALSLKALTPEEAKE